MILVPLATDAMRHRGRIAFPNQLSIGGRPEILRMRRAFTQLFGRALVFASKTLLERFRPIPDSSDVYAAIGEIALDTHHTNAFSHKRGYSHLAPTQVVNKPNAHCFTNGFLRGLIREALTRKPFAHSVAAKIVIAAQPDNVAKRIA